MNKKLVAYIAVEVRDQYGKIVHYEKKEANSLVRGFIDQLYVNMSIVALPNCKAVDDTTVTINTNATNLQVQSPAGETRYGIRVGTGTTGVTVTDNKLANAIAHGSGAGQLNYLVTTFTTPATVGSTHSFTISRGFTNQSGSTINVTEVSMQTAFNAQPNSLLADRTLMSFSVANNATATVTYTVQVSV